MTIHPIIYIIAGFLFWSALFLLFYGVQATGCHLAGDNVSALGQHPILRSVLIGLLLLSIAAGIGPFLRARKRRAERQPADETAQFVREVGGYVWLAAAIAIPFSFGGVAWLTLCGT